MTRLLASGWRFLSRRIWWESRALGKRGAGRLVCWKAALVMLGPQRRSTPATLTHGRGMFPGPKNAETRQLEDLEQLRQLVDAGEIETLPRHGSRAPRV